MNVCIEYDGIQHYEVVEFFRQNLDDIKYHDALKCQYCKDNNIPLLRIKYNEKCIFDKIKNELEVNGYGS